MDIITTKVFNEEDGEIELEATIENGKPVDFRIYDNVHVHTGLSLAQAETLAKLLPGFIEKVKKECEL